MNAPIMKSMQEAFKLQDMGEDKLGELFELMDWAFQLAGNGSVSPAENEKCFEMAANFMLTNHDQIEKRIANEGYLDSFVLLLNGCNNLTVVSRILQCLAAFLNRSCGYVDLLSEESIGLVNNLLLQFTPDLVAQKEGSKMMQYLLLILRKLIESHVFYPFIMTIDFSKSLISFIGYDNELDPLILECLNGILIKWYGVQESESESVSTDYSAFIMSFIVRIGSLPNILHIVCHLCSILHVVLLCDQPNKELYDQIALIIAPWRRFAETEIRKNIFDLIYMLNYNENKAETFSQKCTYLWDVTTAGMIADSLTRDSDSKLTKFALMLTIKMLVTNGGECMDILFNSEQNYNILPLLYGLMEQGSFVQKKMALAVIQELTQRSPQLFEPELKLDSEDVISFDRPPPLLVAIVESIESCNDEDEWFLHLAVLSSIEKWFEEKGQDYVLPELFEVSGVTNILQQILEESDDDGVKDMVQLVLSHLEHTQ